MGRVKRARTEERLLRERELRIQANRYERGLRRESIKARSEMTEQMANSHALVHRAESMARDKAETSIDKRLEGMNEFRDQLRTQASSFLTIAVFDAHWKDLGTQLGDIKLGITDLQKTDLGSESRRSGFIRGQGQVIAAIITSVTLASLILGIVIILSNAFTK